MKLFVDTSAWAATYDKTDQWHAAAREAMASLVDQRVTFTTTDYVVDETITLLLYRTGRQHALAFGDAVQRSKQVRLVRVDADVWEQAWQPFRSYEDKTWAFTDCTSFVVMRQMGLIQAFAFDNHFEQAGFQLWPGMSTAR
jgi:predicted nucleic acid-binding protein